MLVRSLTDICLENMEFITKLVEDGKITPVIDRRYSLEQANDAMQYLGEGHAQGKVVLNVGVGK